MTHINIKEILWKLHIDSLTAMQQTTVEEYRKGKTWYFYLRPDREKRSLICCL